MVYKWFWQDPYCAELETRVSAVKGKNICLEETIFYAFSGGQESDSGTIASMKVLEATKEGQEIIYLLAADHGLKVGDKVKVEIDWLRRYKFMRLHFAAELVLELMYRNLSGIEKIGAHIAEDKARIDFQWSENLSTFLPELEQEVNQMIAHRYDIISEFSDRALQQRFWKIAGFAQVPCGGTHIKNTFEIGGIKLSRKNLGKDKERLEITLLNS
jgi:Ser-tRNA(Ala) deacylase AlaX